jgi:hypothetical protein
MFDIIYHLFDQWRKAFNLAAKDASPEQPARSNGGKA